MDELLDESIPSEEIKKHEDIYIKAVESNNVTTEVTFNYAWCLVRSKYAADMRKGICLLENLFKDGSEKDKRDYIYFLAVGNGRLKEYSKALEYLRLFLSLEPGNQQVQALSQEIKRRMEKDGLKGIVTVGAAAVVVGALVGVGMKLLKN